MYNYRIFGYNVLSELELKCYSANFEVPDIVISIVNYLGTNKDKYEFIEKNENDVILYIPDVGIFEIIDGNKINIQPNQVNDTRSIELFTLGSSFGALMIQRGDYPLHGSLVEKNGVGIGIVGASGAGKSSLAAAFVQNGYSIITDDVMKISRIDGIAYVEPSYPSQKLWRDSAMNLEISIKNSQAISNRDEKFYRDDEKIFSKHPVRLDYIFEIEPIIDSGVRVKQLTQNEQLDVLIRNTYRYSFVKRMRKIASHFHFIMNIMQQVKVGKIIRPVNGFTVQEQVNEIVNKGVKNV